MLMVGFEFDSISMVIGPLTVSPLAGFLMMTKIPGLPFAPGTGWRPCSEYTALISWLSMSLR